MPSTFGDGMKEEFGLNPKHTYLNHGSYGQTPKVVREERLRLLNEMETNPDVWFRVQKGRYWDEHIKAASDFLHANPENLVFVQSATAGINCVLKSLGLKSGDVILTYSWQYKAIHNACLMTARMTGCEVVTAEVKLPINSKEDIIQMYREALDQHPNTKVAVLELMSSPTATVMPVREVTALCRQRGVAVVVDGAHGPGHIPLNLEELGSAGVGCFVGTFHKWLYTTKGCSVLWIRPDLHSTVRPVVTSAVLDSSPSGGCFRFQGTRDETPFFTTKAAVKFYEDLGGMEPIVKYSRELLDKAVALLVEGLGVSKFPIPAELEAPCMRLVALPRIPSLESKLEAEEVFGDAMKWVLTLMQRFEISVPVLVVHGVPYVRLSSNVYNTASDYQRLLAAIKALQAEEGV